MVTRPKPSATGFLDFVRPLLTSPPPTCCQEGPRMKRPFASLFNSGRGNMRRRRAPRAPLHVEELESRLAPSVNVLNFHNDTASTGLNANENQLTPANVRVGSFGKLFTTPLDGQVYAQPLIDTGVAITAGVNTRAGATGV